ncbi:MAG TPA: DUF4010 domain-containing protein, partial [Giesbergeria sp.]|nr:DUF4010 domain-containing protein [Giesbergeria sp.]
MAVLASALGCGLLMGIERERRKGDGPFRSLAGVRSFALAALSGAAAALIGSTALVAVVGVFIAALAVTAYARDRSGDPGVTTEIALLLAYLIGVLCASDQLLAAALAVAATGLLAARDSLHQFSRDWLQPGEVRSGLILAALLLLVAPLVPNEALWQGLLNPHVVMLLLLVLLVIQSLAHVGRRLLQARQAMALSALASGFVSSTATIASLGMEAREGTVAVRAQAGAAVLSCVATMAQIVVVAAAVQPAWLARLWAPALAGAVVAGAWGWWRVRGATGGPEDGTTRPQLPPDTAMFKLRDAALIAALLTAVQVGVQLLTRWQGDAGMLAGALLAALADVHAATAALLVQGGPASPMAPAVAQALMA